MDVRHYLAIFNDNNNDPVVRLIRSRSFDDINFKKFYQGEKKFGIVSKLIEKIEFSENQILYLFNNNAYPNLYEFDDQEDNQSRKARLIAENPEQSYSLSNMGELANAYGRYEVNDKNLNKQIAGFTSAVLKNSLDEVIDEVNFEGNGISLKEVNDFCEAVHAIHNNYPYLNFSQITEQLFSEYEDQACANNYKLLTKVLKKVGKFKNIKSRNTQLQFDLFGNITASSNGVKQKQ